MGFHRAFRWSRHAALLVTALALTLPLDARQGQATTVLVVDDDGGPGVDHTSIAEAVAAAEEGELVLVHAGRYGGFLVSNKSVRVVGAGDGPVELAGNVRIQFLSGSQQVVLRDLVSPSAGTPFTITLFQNLGRVLVEHCTVGPHGSSSSFAALSSEGDTSVALVRSRFRGGAAFPQVGGGGGNGQPAVDATASNLWAYNCDFQGGDGAAPGADGGAAVRLTNFELLLADCELRGGDGAAAQACGDGGNGGNGLEQVGFVSNVRVRATRFIGGAGALAGCVGNSRGADGVGLLKAPGANTLTSLGPQSRSFQVGPPVGPGQPLVLAYDAPSTDLVATYRSTLLGNTPYFNLGGVALIVPQGTSVFRGPRPAGGQLTVDAPTQWIPAGWETVTVYLQTLFVPTNGESPVLGPPTAAVLLAR